VLFTNLAKPNITKICVTFLADKAQYHIKCDITKMTKYNKIYNVLFTNLARPMTDITYNVLFPKLQILHHFS